MREINLYLRNSIYGTVTVDSSNKNLDTRVPVIVRSQPAVFFVRIFNNVNSVAAMTAAELNSLASTWVLNISPVANHTVPVCLQNDGFEVMSNGKLRLTISQTDTVESAKAINKLTRAVWSAELSGLPAGSLNPSVILRFKMCYENRIMDEDATPTENVTLFYTKVQIDSMLADVGAAIPHATETQYGTVELASEAEVTAGVDTERVVVPSTLKVELDKKESLVNKATDFTVSNDTKYPTVKAVVEYLALAIAGHGLVAAISVEELTVDAEEGKIGIVVNGGVFVLYEKGETEWAPLEYAGLSDVSDALKLIRGEEVEGSPIWLNGKDAYQEWLEQGNTGDINDFFNAIGGLTPDEKAKVATINLETLDVLSGTIVNVLPWKQYKWVADGICTLIVSGWATSGKQVSELLITLTEGSTLGIIGAEVDEEKDAITESGVYSCFLKNLEGIVRFKKVDRWEAEA